MEQWHLSDEDRIHWTIGQLRGKTITWANGRTVFDLAYQDF